MTWRLEKDFIEPTLGEFRFVVKNVWIMQTIGKAWMAGLCHFEDEPEPDEVLAESRHLCQVMLATALKSISPVQRAQFNFIDPKYRPFCLEEGCGQALECLFIGFEQPLYQTKGLNLAMVTKCPEDDHGGIQFQFSFPEEWEGEPGFHVQVNLLSVDMFDDQECDDPSHDHSY